MRPAIRLALSIALACSLAGPALASAASCPPVTTGRHLAPSTGVLFGASLDWSTDSVRAYARRLGRRPATNVYFVDLPLKAKQTHYLDEAVDQIRDGGGMLLLTLEPTRGLAAVTPPVARRVTTKIASYNRRGVPVLVRFAHEMNGSWYPWAQQPAAYVKAFRTVASAVHRGAPGSAMLWAPNYGGGYPFAGGRYQAVAGSRDAAALDTDHDGAVTRLDDPYAPYYPGDAYVDWVGMTLYHFGNVYPWGENEIPEPGKFAALLTGTYDGLNGDESAVPDFYTTWAAGHHKPLAVPETAALYAPGGPGASQLAVKQAWWRQVFAPSVHVRFPLLRMINWFEWDKQEVEVHARVDWTATTSPTVARRFRAALPSWLRFAGAVPGCRSAQR